MESPRSAGDPFRGLTADLVRRSRGVPTLVRAPGAEEPSARVIQSPDGQLHLRARLDRDAADCASSDWLPEALGPALLPGRPDGEAHAGAEAPAGCGDRQSHTRWDGQDGGDGAAPALALAGARAAEEARTGTLDAGLRRLGDRYHAHDGGYGGRVQQMKERSSWKRVDKS